MNDDGLIFWLLGSVVSILDRIKRDLGLASTD